MTENKTVHFIGIGGIGTSALAQWFLSEGWNVTGSDLEENELVEKLEEKGAQISIGHNKDNLLPTTDLVIRSGAIPADNPELRKARSSGIPVKSYPEALGKITRDHNTIAVAGTHGKSTTTSMLAEIMIEAGLDPTVLVGTKADITDADEKNNFRSGQSEYLLLEADEWKGSFLNHHPDHMAVLNIDEEHLDFYKNLQNIKKTFLLAIRRVKPEGHLVLNKEDKNISDISDKIKEIANQEDIRITEFSKVTDLAQEVKESLQVPGRHNLENGLAAYHLAKGLGIEKETILKSLNQYEGCWRRLEPKGKIEKSLLYEDYGHHPTEIEATLQGLKEKYPDKKITCVFQPHQGKRLKNLFEQFVDSFSRTDKLILLPTYKVAGRDKIHEDHTSEKLAEKIEEKHEKEIEYLQDPSANKIKETAETESESSIILMMGAGNIHQITKKLSRKS